MRWWRGFDWKGLVGWTVATCVGVQGVTFLFADAVLGNDLDGVVAGPAAMAIIGAIFGVGQWLWLRKRMEKAAGWILATTVGWFCLAVFAVAVPSSRNEQSFPGWFLLAAIVLLDLPQWLVLRRKCARANWWPAARLLGWIFGAGLVFLGMLSGGIRVGLFGIPAGVFGLRSELLAWSFGGLLFGLGFSLATGVTMLWILQKPKEVGAQRVCGV